MAVVGAGYAASDTALERYSDARRDRVGVARRCSRSNRRTADNDLRSSFAGYSKLRQ